QVISRLQRTFGVEIPLRAMFEDPTVAGLATRFEQLRLAGDALQTPPLRPVPRVGKEALSFSQQRLWFLEQLQPGTPAYNMAIALRLSGTLNVVALQESLQETVRRHEVLRTTFVVGNDEPFQRIDPDLKLKFPTIDLSAVPQDTREQEALRTA